MLWLGMGLGAVALSLIVIVVLVINGHPCRSCGWEGDKTDNYCSHCGSKGNHLGRD